MIFTQLFYIKKQTKQTNKQTKSNTITFQYYSNRNGTSWLSIQKWSSGGVRGRSPRKLMEFIHIQCSSTLKMTRCSMFWLCFILHDVKYKLMQYDSISILLKKKWYFMVFYPQMWRLHLPDLSLLSCLPNTIEAKVGFQSLLTSNTILVIGYFLLLFNFCCILCIPLELKFVKWSNLISPIIESNLHLAQLSIK